MILLKNLLTQLSGVKKSGDSHVARCPGHDDHRQSLSITQASDRILIKCHAGCETETIVSKLNLNMADLFESNGAAPKRIEEAAYDYRDETGQLLFQAVRYRDPKQFKQRRPDGSGGWIWDLKKTRRVLYGLPELLAANQDATVFLPEGEKDRDRLCSIGLVATTCPMGAGKWRDEYNESLRSRDVVILPDNDPPDPKSGRRPGQEHAEQVARALHGVARSVKVLALPGLPEKGDVSDWIDSGGDAEALCVLAENAPEWDPAKTGDPPLAPRFKFRTAAELSASTSAEASWIVKPWIARGSVTELSGKIKAAGKTTFTLALCRAAVRGESFLDVPVTKTRVLYLTEQADASFRIALDRAGLSLSQDFEFLSFHLTSGAKWPEVVQAVVERAIETKADLVVVDTLGQFSGLRGSSENDSGAALEAMLPLQTAAAKYGLGVLVIRHERKGANLEVGESSRGSSAFAGAVDIVMSLRRPDGRNARPGQRQIQSLSRFSETPANLLIELVDGDYRSLGDAATLARHEAASAIVTALPELEIEGRTLDELCDSLELKRTVAQEAIRDLTEAHRITRNGRGKKGSPFRYSQNVAAAEM